MNKAQTIDDKLGGEAGQTFREGGLRELTEQQIRAIKIKKYITIGIDTYGATGPVALGIAGILAATGIGAPIAALLTAYAGFTEAADVVTGPLTGLYIQLAYGKTGVGVLEAALELIPVVGDLFPGTTLAHNLYLDQLREQGFEVADNLYILPGVYNHIRKEVHEIIDRGEKQGFKQNYAFRTA